MSKLSDSLGVAAAGFGFNALGNFINNGFTHSANSMSYKRQLALMQEQFNQQLYFWNLNNAYNSPSAQVQRYLAAGINPYSAMSNGGYSSVGSMPSGASPASASVMPSRFDMSGVNGVLDSYMDIQAQKRFRDAQASNAEQDAAGKEIDNKSKAAKNAAEIDELKSRAKSHKARAELDDISTSLKQATFSTDVAKANYEAMNERDRNAIIVAQGIQIGLQNELAELDIKSYGTRLASELALNAAKIYQAYAAGELSYKEAAFAVQQTSESVAREQGIKISNKQANEISKHVIAKAEAEAKKAHQLTEGQEFYDGFIPRHYRKTVNTLLQPLKGVLNFSGQIK